LGETDLQERYFKWLCKKIKLRSEYSKLAEDLHKIPFRYSIAMDGNREADGINLRYRFGRESDYDDFIIAQDVDIFPCSVFEVMVGLCIRMEEQFMHNMDKCDRTGLWFTNMLESLDISGLTNNAIKEPESADILERAVNRFLDREYEANGKGGLFTIKNRRGFSDMRTVELWYQMCLYLDDILGF